MDSANQTSVSDVQMSLTSPGFEDSLFESSAPLKVYYTYEDIHKLVDRSAEQIKKIDPDYIIAIGGGGLIPGRMVRRISKVPIIVVTVNFYDEEDQINPEPVIVQWHSNSEKLRGKKCLIVDEVNDSGSTLRYVIDRLMNEDGVTDLSALVIHHKEKDNFDKTEINNFLKDKLNQYLPLIVLGDIWIVYPWETDDIVEHNLLAQNKPANLVVH